jgi:hypothetical protein
MSDDAKCPYVVGRTTLHCSLTPFTLTDAEREALEWAARSSLAWTNEAAGCKSALSRIALSDRTAKKHFAAIRGLLERLN